MSHIFVRAFSVVNCQLIVELRLLRWACQWAIGGQFVLTQPELISDPIRRMVSETLYPIFQYTGSLFGH